MVRRIAILVAAVALAAALLIASPSSRSHAGTRGDCTVRASIPRPLSPGSTQAKLYAWGELRCARAGRVAIEICAVRFTPGGQIVDARLVWCVHRTVKVAAGAAIRVRTLLRTCTPGKAYRSSIAVVGRPNDTGPYKVCRSL
jgi:hypothetical protein